MEWSRSDFVTNLRFYMARDKVNQREVAEIAGVSEATVSQWLSKKKYPRIDRVEKLAMYFDIEKSDLLENKENPAMNGGISMQKKELIKFVRSVPDDQVEMILRVMKSILGEE